MHLLLPKNRKRCNFKMDILSNQIQTFFLLKFKSHPLFFCRVRGANCPPSTPLAPPLCAGIISSVRGLCGSLVILTASSYYIIFKIILGVRQWCFHFSHVIWDLLIKFLFSGLHYEQWEERICYYYKEILPLHCICNVNLHCRNNIIIPKYGTLVKISVPGKSVWIPFIAENWK